MRKKTADIFIISGMTKLRITNAFIPWNEPFIPWNEPFIPGAGACAWRGQGRGRTTFT
jgi:hypothetical protein